MNKCFFIFSFFIFSFATSCGSIQNVTVTPNGANITGAIEVVSGDDYVQNEALLEAAWELCVSEECSIVNTQITITDFDAFLCVSFDGFEICQTVEY